MVQTQTLKLLLAGAVAALLVLLGMITGQHAPAPLVSGSVSVSNEYISTTTAASNAAGLTAFPTIAVLKPGYGTLGSAVVLVAGSAGGSLELYDATTSNVNLRTGQKATSTILLASLPSNLAAGTYTFDVSFGQGLLAITTGTLGTTTITYR